jgi:hypothetical protein
MANVAQKQFYDAARGHMVLESPKGGRPKAEWLDDAETFFRNWFRAVDQAHRKFIKNVLNFTETSLEDEIANIHLGKLTRDKSGPNSGKV